MLLTTIFLKGIMSGTGFVFFYEIECLERYKYIYNERRITMKKLGFGLMRLPIIGGDHSKIDIDAMKKMVDEFMARGFTYFDTAYVYHGGQSEVAFREAVVKRYPRDAFTVTTKLPLFSKPDRAGMEKIFKESMERLGVEYIDYYWLHAMNKDLYEHAESVDAFGYLKELKAAGKIKHIGFSFHDGPEVLEKMLSEHPEVEYVQLQINYLDWEDGWVRGRRCYEVATRYGKPVIVMEPVKGGALANLPKSAARIFDSYDPKPSYASWAIRYCASLDNVMTVLSGMSNLEQVLDNTGYMEDFKPLTEEDYKVIEKVAQNLKFAIPCTACRYCTDGCPMKISIPDIFALYNEYKRDMKKLPEFRTKYMELTSSSSGKASACIGCEQCKEHCPQNLDIPKLLAECVLELE